MNTWRSGAALVALTSVFAAADARAASTEIQLGVGPSAYASTWRCDYGAGGTLRLGMRFAHVLGFDFQAWESLASVDTRLNTGLSLGVRGTLPLRAARPYVRAFVIHQHEEGIVSAQNSPLGILAGVGAGIRHRAGAGGSLGVEIPVRSVSKRTTILFFTQTNATWLSNHLGPSVYVGLDLGVGMDFLL